MRALLSLYDKSGLEDLARALVSSGYGLVASGGTARALSGLGFQCTAVEDLTGFAEMLGGRVKTLHPAIHGPILADRTKPEHMNQIAERGWDPIDVVAVNLYPFESDPSVELIDIGGPALVRAAAKNHESVTVVVDPDDYPVLIDSLKSGVTFEQRKRLAAKAFGYVSAYDARIANWLASDRERIVIELEKVQDLRYGENPHQRGALYRQDRLTGWGKARWLAGEEPSYLNIFDSDKAWDLLRLLGNEPACVIVKHGSPCGAAVDNDMVSAYQRAFDGDPLSAFGGVIAINRTLDTTVAQAILSRPKCDVVVCPSAEQAAVDMIASKRKRTRIVEFEPATVRQDVRVVSGGYLVQDPDAMEDLTDYRIMTSRIPSESELQDAWMAMAVARSVGSNAVTLVKDQAVVGVGGGQPSRVDAAKIAVSKAGERAAGAAAASDAFFPFPDGLETLIQAGASIVVAPSGSVKDNEIVSVAEAAGISFLFGPRRHFRH